MPASLLETTAAPAAAPPAAPASRRGRAAVAARGALGGAGHRRCSRPGSPPTSRTPRPRSRGRSSSPATRPAAGSRGWPACGRCAGKTLDVDLLMVRRRDRRGRGRAGPGRRPADRHLRHLRRPGGGGHPPHRPGRARPARPRPRPGHAGSARPASEQVVDAASLRIGDVILVRPGERIAADGQVLSGASDVDQATITGEPLPVAKNPGDEVFAGTVNGTGALRVRVEPGRLRHRGRPDRRHGRAGIGDQGQDAAVHREGRAALLARHGHRDPAAVRGPAARRRRVPADAAARDDLHDRRLAVRGRARHDAAAAGRDGQRRAGTACWSSPPS